MLKFYYHPLSPLSRRVWLGLLEKKIAFEPILVDVGGGEQNKPEFLALNPFHHVPVIIDDGFKLIESLAILEYLELKYPQPSLSMESSPEAIARSKMIQMVIVNELGPKFLAFANAEVQPVSKDILAQTDNIFRFLAEQLGESTYFGGEGLNLADILVGVAIPLLCRCGVSLQLYPNLDRWEKKITEREAWQITNPKEEDFQSWRRWIQLMIKRRQSKNKK